MRKEREKETMEQSESFLGWNVISPSCPIIPSQSFPDTLSPFACRIQNRETCLVGHLQELIFDCSTRPIITKEVSLSFFLALLSFLFYEMSYNNHDYFLLVRSFVSPLFSLI